MFRIGSGYDLHRLVEGRKLILGGIEVPYDRGLDGHSDADVLLHAITDAILGAAGLGNIGQLFPDTDPVHKNADSKTLLQEAVARLRNEGYSVVNVDATIVAQAPKLNPHVADMQATIARVLEVPDDAVSVKPKTNEGVGPEGRGEAISAYASVLISRADT